MGLGGLELRPLAQRPARLEHPGRCPGPRHRSEIGGGPPGPRVRGSRTTHADSARTQTSGTRLHRRSEAVCQRTVNPLPLTATVHAEPLTPTRTTSSSNGMSEGMARARGVPHPCPYPPVASGDSPVLTAALRSAHRQVRRRKRPKLCKAGLRVSIPLVSTTNDQRKRWVGSGGEPVRDTSHDTIVHTPRVMTRSKGPRKRSRAASPSPRAELCACASTPAWTRSPGAVTTWSRRSRPARRHRTRPSASGRSSGR